MKKITSWSVSKIQTYLSCPRKFKENYLLGKPFKSSPAMERGNRIHAMAEHYLAGNIRGLPNELTKLRSHYQNLKKVKPMVELKLAVDSAWKVTGWNKGWCRGILDVIDRSENEMLVIDHKTGKVYDKHEEQGEVYACLAAATSREIESVHVEFWYTDQGMTREFDYTLEEIKDLKKHWSGKAKKMLTATRYPETPSVEACRWCDASSAKGGRCEGWRSVSK